MLKKGILLSFCLVFVLAMVYGDEGTIRRLREPGQLDPGSITPDPMLDEAMDCTYTFTTTGSSYWRRVTDVYYYDGDSARSGTITHGQSTSMSTTIDFATASVVKFCWKVSSEAGYDYLKFYIDGVLKGQISGTVGWTQVPYTVTAGSHTLTWTYVKDGSVSSGSDCGWADKLEVISIDPIAEALDCPGQVFILSGDGDWFCQTGSGGYGDDYAQSPVLTHNQGASMETTISGITSLTFYWKVSSENGYDFLSFYVDGTLKARISGSTDWTQQAYAVTSASHTLKWTYAKDGSGSSGSDCGMVDHLQLN